MKKIPQRSCVICRQKKDKNQLIRIVKNKENEISIDETGKKDGRGAYICHSIECLEKAIKTKVLKKVFEVDIDEKVYENIRESINRG
ncbi:MAG: YlxR family protein [Clostridia bacterium]|nr:YlxR family protein [Clostridia bacterium]